MRLGWRWKWRVRRRGEKVESEKNKKRKRRRGERNADGGHGSWKFLSLLIDWTPKQLEE